MTLAELLSKVVEKENLSRQEARVALRGLLDPSTPSTLSAAFLSALRTKGETPEEIAGFVEEALLKARRVPSRKGGILLDTCGTGGAPIKTFNVSTLTALVVAASGVRVAKHGNRSSSSPTGSADLLEALGARLETDPELESRILEEVGFVFLWAPSHHPSFKSVAPIRRELGIRTIFNLVGPLSNPAEITHHLLGVPSLPLLEVLSEALSRVGRVRAYVVHGRVHGGEGGMDEISLSGPTSVRKVERSGTESFTTDPSEVGIPPRSPQEVSPLPPLQAAQMALEILRGKKGARTDMVLLNSAWALHLCGVVRSAREGLEVARNSIEEGGAFRILKEYVERTGGILRE